MKYFLIVAFSVCTGLLYSQAGSKEYNKSMELADSEFEIGNFFGALKMYNDLYPQDSLNKVLNYKIGVCHFWMDDYNTAWKKFEKSSAEASPEILRYKASIAHLRMEFGKALNFYNAYKLVSGEKDVSNEEINRLIEKTKYAEQIIEKKRDVLVQNLGSVINTEHSEYVPLISADGETMLFTSRRPGNTGGKVDPNGEPFEDVFATTKVDNSWVAPKALGKGINTATNDACAGLSPDGQILFLFRTHEDLISANLYESRMGLEDWEDPVKLGSNINSGFIESSASITFDDRVLYFSSDRPGGFGGRDIYKVLRLPNGKWSKALNLGPLINTPFDEDAPFIHTDKKTLYFSSTGHDNMGGFDIFKTELKDGNWSVPENIGYPINTVSDDIFYVVEASGKVGYYSSSREGGYGGQDIYKVVLKDEFIKQHVLKGVVKDAKSGDPITAKVTLIENESKKVQGIYKSNIHSGKFILLINPQNTYNVIIESKGYYPYKTELEFNVNDDKRYDFALEKRG